MHDPAPFGLEDFDAAMGLVGPFEASPHLAVAVSGGADSLALCFLTHRWAGARGGRVTALTVDHRLRSGSPAEAMRVGRWVNARGIEHRVLPWIGEKPAAGIQAAARAARYRLMSRWCEDAGVLHLLLGHHQGDQAETVLMRQGRGSGLDGLAGMAAVVETAAVRLVRPLLAMSPARLRAVLSGARQPWIEDPSNSDPAFTRNRVRSLLPRLAESGVAVPAVIADSARMARARTALDGAVSTLLARCCHLYPGGYARLNACVLASAPGEVSTRALGGLLAVVGGLTHAPRVEKLERIVFRMVRDRSLSAATLGRCRLVRAGDGILVCREGRGLPAPRVAVADCPLHWDGRFSIDFAASKEARADRVRLIALGASAAKQVAGAGGDPPTSSRHVPRQAWAALPALADDQGIVIVPHLNYQRQDGPKPSIRFRSISFRPHRPLTGGGRYLA